MRMGCAAAALAMMVLAGVASANPRDGATVVNLASDGSNLGGTGSFLGGSYAARYVRIRGLLSPVIAGSWAREAMIVLTAPGGQTCGFAPSTQQAMNGQIQVDGFFRLPGDIAAFGNWDFSALETYDDGGGADARWDSLTITLNDGPPATTANFGVLDGQPLSYTTGLSAGSVKWFKFEVPYAIASGSGTYLDIDTEGTAVGGASFNNDTYIALYTADGAVVAADDDGGSGYLSQLTFGAGTRPAVGSGSAYDGRNGSLAAGTYYLRVGGYSVSTSAQVGWDFPATGSLQAGSVRVNIRTNAGQSAFCRADFNRDGTLAVQDIFDYLSAWFAGCP